MKSFLRLFTLALLLAPLTVRAADASKPNVVIIFIDDLGYADIGPFGATKQKTPHLDRMAREGMKLTSFYAAPVCSVSRAQLLTGCYGARVSVPGVYGPGGKHGLNPAEHTIAERLKERGYATQCIGKWHAGEDSVSILPALLGKDATPLRAAVVHHSINGMFAIRQGPWKLELCPGSGGWGKPGDADASAQGLPAVQLYDLSSDIGETKNLHSANPEIVAKLTSLLESHVANGRSTPGAKQPNDVKVTFMNKDHTKPKNDTQPVAKEPGN